MREIFENIVDYVRMLFNTKKFNEKAVEYRNRERSKSKKTENDVTNQYRKHHIWSFIEVILSVSLGVIAGYWIENNFSLSFFSVKIIRITALMLVGITVFAALPSPTFSDPYQKKLSQKVMKYFYLLSLFLASMSLFMI